MTMKHYEDTSVPRRDGMAHVWCGDTAPVVETTIIRSAVGCPGCLGAMVLDETPRRAVLASDRTGVVPDRQIIVGAHAALDELGVPRVREVTAESITDEQIRDFRNRYRMPHGENRDVAYHCDLSTSTVPAVLRQARGWLAATYNALPATERQLTLPERIRLLGAERDRLRGEVLTLRDWPTDRSGV